MLALATYLLGIGIPETYPREIMRSRAKRLGMPLRLQPAQSGVTLGDMFQVTVLSPLQQLATEPIVIGICLYLSFNFGVLFEFFVAIPVVLSATYMFDIQQVGLAFIAAIGGSLLAALTSSIIEKFTSPKCSGKNSNDMMDIEYRLIPAMAGGIGITGSLFWIAWTASPTTSWASPVFGTLLYVWGNMSVLISGISYLFDAYPPRGTLSALTVVASMRLLFAGAFPLFIIPMIMRLTGAWTYSTFGFISAVLIPLPWLLFKFGPQLRAQSKYNRDMVGSLGAHNSKEADVEMQSVRDRSS